jgi:hypothetical protein
MHGDVAQMKIIQGIQTQRQSQGALTQLVEIPTAYHKKQEKFDNGLAVVTSLILARTRERLT